MMMCCKELCTCSYRMKCVIYVTVRFLLPVRRNTDFLLSSCIEYSVDYILLIEKYSICSKNSIFLYE